MIDIISFVNLIGPHQTVILLQSLAIAVLALVLYRRQG